MNAARSHSWWPHMRGALVLLHIIAVLVLSTPDLGGGLSRKAWKSEAIQTEIGLWAERLNRWGADTSTQQLEQQAWDAATGWTELRETILIPFVPYARYLGVRQRWRMFAGPDRVPARIRVAVERDGEWQTVYEARSSEHRWRARELDHERLRVIINRSSWPHNSGLYKRLLRFIVAAAAEDFPEATRVRVSYLRARTPTAAQLRAGETPAQQEIRVRVRDLEDAR